MIEMTNDKGASARALTMQIAVMASTILRQTTGFAKNSYAKGDCADLCARVAKMIRPGRAMKISTKDTDIAPEESLTKASPMANVAIESTIKRTARVFSTRYCTFGFIGTP